MERSAKTRGRPDGLDRSTPKERPGRPTWFSRRMSTATARHVSQDRFSAKPSTPFSSMAVILAETGANGRVSNRATPSGAMVSEKMSVKSASCARRK